MKRILITCLLLISLLCVNAQKINIKTGFNLATFYSENNDRIISSDFDTNSGLSIGVNIEYPINKTFAIETGMQFSMEGTEIHNKREITFGGLGQEISTNLDIDLYYMNVPFNAKVYIVNSKVKVFGLLGAYWGIGLYGNKELSILSYSDSDTEDEKIKWGDDSENDDFRRFDYGLNIGTGIEANRFLLSINYNYGLENISTYIKNGTAFYNRVLTFSIGYVIKE